jgi:heme oxygenase
MGRSDKTLEVRAYKHCQRGYPMSLMLALREGTRAQHERLESNLDLLDGGVGLEAYRALLERFYGFYLPLEDRLALLVDWSGLAYDYDDRRKVPLLERDLSALGAVPQNAPAVAAYPALPRLEGLAQAVGCLYVLEGSTLGGQILSRHFMAHLGLTENTGCAFFSGYGALTGPRWKAFGAFVAEHLADPVHYEPAVGAANETFERLGDWLLLEKGPLAS